MEAVTWSEDIPFPHICEYHREGCDCGSPEGIRDPDLFAGGKTPDPCDYCYYDCQCGAADWEPEDEDDEEPDCTCECECCHCEETCDCEGLLVTAESFNEWVKEVCFTCSEQCLGEILPLENEDAVLCKTDLGGGYSSAVRVMPTHMRERLFGFLGFPSDVVRRVRSSLDIYDGMRKSWVRFDGPVMIPMLRGPTPGHAKPFWMSLTPMEVFSLREGIDLAQGRVLCAGLGMGWMTMRILEKPDVTHVTQIEMSPEVVEFSGKPLAKRFPGKIDFVIDDVWEYLSDVDLDQFDSIIFDIWPQYGTAHMDRRFQQLKDLHPLVWGWGDA